MLRIIFIVLFFSLQSNIFSQNLESFFSQNWLDSENTFGTKEKFIINEFEQLQLSDLSASGTSNNAYLSFASNVINNAEWELFVRIDAATSGSNFVRFFLVSDQADLSGSLNGYFVMIGNTGDEISLYRQSGTTRTRIIDGEDRRIDFPRVEVYVRVTRDEDGNWELFSRLASENEYRLEGITTDLSVFRSSYAGIFVQYSSGNRERYFFDNLSISGEPFVRAYDLQLNDIVFSELMVRPRPAVNLPEYEWIELHNTTPHRVNLSGFYLVEESRRFLIENAIIEPFGYLVLCAASNLEHFSEIDFVAGMRTFPTLTDGGKLLWLEDSEGNLISWVEYSDSWYGDNFKSAGGWSLERIDLSNASNNADNWRASMNTSGGTPGKTNSVSAHNPDVLLPRISDVAIKSEYSIEVFFSEPMDVTALMEKENYMTFGLNIISIETAFPKGESVVLHFDSRIEERVVYDLILSNITDMAGNPLQRAETRFALPESIEPLDIVINEVLFNPPVNGVRYVELYNRSNKTLDISELILTSRRNGELLAGTLLSNSRSLFFAGEYLLLTTNIDVVCEQYLCDPNSKKIQLSSFPSYPIAEGTVVLVHRDSRIIDEFSYSERMHHSMVRHPRGVSLERINPNMETQNPNNWHSASFTSGYGTPGYQNSQFSADFNTNSREVWLEPERFSPNNDGIDDVLNIFYSLDRSGYTGSIYIFDSLGRRVRTLINNVLLDTEGVIRWNGEDDNGRVANIGIYVIYVELVHKNGTTRRHKIPCVLFGD